MTTETARNSFATRPATQKQIDFVTQLLAKVASLSEADAERARSLHNVYRDMHRDGEFTMATASDRISELKDYLKEQHHLLKVSIQWPEVPTGKYAYLKDENDPESVAFFHVVVTESGFPLLWVYSSDEELPIKAVPQKMAVLSKIHDLGPFECERFFGQKSEHCARCGKRLTMTESREYGMGRTCRNK